MTDAGASFSHEAEGLPRTFDNMYPARGVTDPGVGAVHSFELNPAYPVHPVEKIKLQYDNRNRREHARSRSGTRVRSWAAARDESLRIIFSFSGATPAWQARRGGGASGRAGP